MLHLHHTRERLGRPNINMILGHNHWEDGALGTGPWDSSPTTACSGLQRFCTLLESYNACPRNALRQTPQKAEEQKHLNFQEDDCWNHSFWLMLCWWEQKVKAWGIGKRMMKMCIYSIKRRKWLCWEDISPKTDKAELKANSFVTKDMSEFFCLVFWELFAVVFPLRFEPVFKAIRRYHHMNQKKHPLRSLSILLRAPLESRARRVLLCRHSHSWIIYIK